MAENKEDDIKKYDLAFEDWSSKAERYSDQLRLFHPSVTIQEAFVSGYEAGMSRAKEIKNLEPIAVETYESMSWPQAIFFSVLWLSMSFMVFSVSQCSW